MEGADVYFVCIGSNKAEQTLTHRYHSGICIGKTKDVLWRGISLQQYLTNTCAKYLGLTCPRPRNDHYRAFNRIYSQPLFIVEILINLPELLRILLPATHNVKIRFLG